MDADQLRTMLRLAGCHVEPHGRGGWNYLGSRARLDGRLQAGARGTLAVVVFRLRGCVVDPGSVAASRRGHGCLVMARADKCTGRRRPNTEKRCPQCKHGSNAMSAESAHSEQAHTPIRVGQAESSRQP